MFSGKVAQFALNVGYEDIGVLFQHLISRIAFGAKADILPLCEIPFVQVVRARKLHRQGYKTVEDIAGDERQRESRIDSKWASEGKKCNNDKFLAGAKASELSRILDLKPERTATKISEMIIQHARTICQRRAADQRLVLDQSVFGAGSF